MRRSIVSMLVLASIVAACADDDAGVGTSTTAALRPDRTTSTTDATPGTGPGRTAPGDSTTVSVPDPYLVEAPGAPDGDLPVFFFLFTHTEDPFNHELSEERYTTLIPVVERISDDYPDAGLVWTIMFQGSDARTVAERNPGTGVADLIRDAAADGLVEFGYHAHHDPTYDNRPQNEFTVDSTWEDLVGGMAEWVSCRKDLLYGGCIEPEAGGVVAIEEFFGEVAVASGLFTFGYLEGGAGVHAFEQYEPDRMVGFAYPDHGPAVSSGDYGGAIADLLALLAPAWDTSPSVVWIDDVIRITGGNPVEGITGINTLEGPRMASTKLEAVDRARVQVFNAGIASKYHYTVSGTSPTIYGYAHPDSPELPESLLLGREEIDASYATTEQTVEFMARFATDDPGSRFVDADWLVDHIAPPDYFVVTRDQVEAMAGWVVDHWDGAPPMWVYDGLDYFSIRDALVLFSMAVADPATTTFELLPAYGPFTTAGRTPARSVSAVSLTTAADAIASAVFSAAEAPWSATPANLLDPTYEGLTLAQVLDGLAQMILGAGGDLGIPETASEPATIGLLHELACPTCFDTAWSLKPARIRLDG